MPVRTSVAKQVKHRQCQFIVGLLPLPLPCFSVQIKHKICKNMNSVLQQQQIMPPLETK